MLPEAGRRKTVRTVGVVLVVALLLVAVGSYWYLALRPLSMQEVLERSEWHPGDVRDLEGTIANVTRVNTSLGPVVLLELEMPQSLGGGCGAFGNPNATYRVGDRFRTTLHFRSFTYNGRPAVWAPEIACPFPILWGSIGVVMDAVAIVAGIGLRFAGLEAGGWTAYEVITMNGDKFPADRVPASLRRGPPASDLLPAAQSLNSAAAWTLVAAIEYVALTGGYQPEWEIDAMTTLVQGTSPGGRLRFTDLDADGMIGDFDRFSVRLDRNPTEYQTYLLQLGSGMGGGPSALTAGMKTILQTPDGPLHWMPEGWPWVQLMYAGGVVGTTVMSRIEVGRVFGSPRPIEEHEFRLTVADENPLMGPVQDAPVRFPGGISVDFWEPTANGQLDTGDRFFVDGVANQTRVGLEVWPRGQAWASIQWFAGHGRVAGRIPNVEYRTGIGTPYTFGANISHWHPEFAFGRTLAVSLEEDGIPVLDHVPLVPGLLGTWPSGSLAFADVDSDGVWTTADELTLQPNPGSRYRVEVSLLFDSRTFPLDLGP